jgi:hypothetical protein
MDDDKEKSIIEKTIEAVKDIAHTASEAAKHAMEPEPIKPGEEVVMMAPQGGNVLGEPVAPQFVVIPRKKSRRKKAAKTVAKKTAKKTAKKSLKKRAAKKWKSPAKAAAKKTKQSGKKAMKKKKAKR